jgi:allophanate hydrolase subunit 1
MTKVEIHYELAQPMDEALMQRVADAHGLFGMQHVQLAPSMTQLTVCYDASRLTPAQVDAALHRAGIPAVRK